jgi:hypothetical protein
MDSAEFDKYVRILNQFCLINGEEDFKAKGINIPSMTQMVLVEVQKLSVEMDIVEEALNQRIATVYDEYRNDSDIAYDKTEIKNFYIYRDDLVHDLRRKLSILRSQSEFFDGTLQNLSKMGLQINNHLKILEYYAGGR